MFGEAQLILTELELSTANNGVLPPAHTRNNFLHGPQAINRRNYEYVAPTIRTLELASHSVPKAVRRVYYAAPLPNRSCEL